MVHKVKFVEPAKVYQMIKDELDAAYFDVMTKGDLIDRGQLRQFEENLAAFVGTKYTVGLNSGYDALHMSLRAAGIGPGDEVIVPAHTFVATASAVVNVGARPVLVDVGKDFNIDCDRVEEVLASSAGGRRSTIRAIIPVHLSGYMADMVRIMEIAKKYNLVVREDACQSLGSSMENRDSAHLFQGSRDRGQGTGGQRPEIRDDPALSTRHSAPSTKRGRDEGRAGRIDNG
jgi:dTDP-4-amino-4,6-dideoxygalactose transaminase